MMNRIFELLLAVASGAVQVDAIEFNRDVRPILSENCFACHGFDAKKRQSDLRLDVADGAYAARPDGPAATPGDPEKSSLWRRVVAADAEVVMPPPDSHKKLTAAQKDVLKRWIEQGAAYQRHWAFEKPIAFQDPAVKDRDWPRGSIDRFLLAKMEREGVSPNPEADRPTLIRRVAFALTGLPPTPSEGDEFSSDRTADAYEKMVERYLASPRFGEEMARHWLDVARYADTHGLHLDNERQIWPYRDWVVGAFNQNLPYDRFTVWQIAGDLLPNPTVEQRVATGFNRCNVTTSEGGSIAEEFLYRYAVERTSTVVQTWMGLTAGCAVCHDHKYDPLSTREFYSLYSFFYSAADPAMDGNVAATSPYLKLPTPAQEKAILEAEQAAAAAETALTKFAATAVYVDPSAETPPPLAAPTSTMLLDEFFPIGAGSRNTSRNPSRWETDPSFGAPAGRRVLSQAGAYFHEDVVTPALTPFVVPKASRFSMWVRLDPYSPSKVLAVAVATDKSNRRLWWGDPAVAADTPIGDNAKTRRGDLPTPGKWTQLHFTGEDLGLTSGATITSFSFQQVGGVVSWDALEMTGVIEPAGDPSRSFQTWWKSVVGKPTTDVPTNLHKVLHAAPSGKTEPADLDELRRFYLAKIARPIDGDVTEARSKWYAARTDLAAANDAVPGTMVFAELPKPRDAFVMIRGQYDKPGEQVTPGVPAVLPPIKAADAKGPPNRLDLARWMTAPENPLTARVAVNRFWQQFFGLGLVKTSDDFGSQAEPPSHPELLDRLAVDFQTGGWNVKDLVRRIVNSAAFRQDSHGSVEHRRRDPENRLLARGPRPRLDAEQLRDNALFVAGLLNLEIGGRGVKSYQPPNIWEPVGYSDSNTRYYLPDSGPALYRRSLYAFLKRTAPPPFMTNFDGPNREQFCSRREKSNTPLQALQLLNDVQHFEAARALAERSLAVGATPEDRIEFLYKTVLSRGPTAKEIALLTKTVERQQAMFKDDPAAASRVVHFGASSPTPTADPVETAAWTLVANLVLNLDETVTRN
ncbi:MAG: PSD1 and planctomycete cytochrome C domain-containing protein [Planctomycetia bacterium]